MPNQYGNSNSNNHITATKAKTCILLVGHFRNLKNLLRDEGKITFSSLLVIKNSAISAIFSNFCSFSIYFQKFQPLIKNTGVETICMSFNLSR